MNWGGGWNRVKAAQKIRTDRKDFIKKLKKKPTKKQKQNPQTSS